MLSAVQGRARVPEASAFWGALALVLGLTLWLGANRPLPWTLLSLGAAGFLALHMRTGPAMSGAGWRALWPAGAALLAVVAWGWVQSLPLGIGAHPAHALIGRADGAISADPWASRNGVLRLAACAALFCIAAAQTRRTAERALDVIAAFGGMLALYALIALALGVNPLTGPSAYPGSATGSFVNRNAYAYFTGLSAICCAVAISRSRGQALAVRVLRILCLMVLLAALIQTGSRAGVAASVAGGVALACLTGGRGWVLPLASMAALLVAAGAAGPLVQRMAENPLLDQRMTVYGLIVEGIADRPLMGHGLGAFQDTFRAYVPVGFSGSDWDRGHNSYLEAAFELGLPAALTFYGALGWIVLQLVRGLRRAGPGRPVVGAAIAMTVAGALHALVDFSLQMPATAALFALVLGLGWGMAHRCGRRMDAPGIPE